MFIPLPSTTSFPLPISSFPHNNQICKISCSSGIFIHAQERRHDHNSKRSVKGYLYQMNAWDTFHFSGKWNKYFLKNSEKLWTGGLCFCSCQIGKPKRLKCVYAARALNEVRFQRRLLSQWTQGLMLVCSVAPNASYVSCELLLVSRCFSCTLPECCLSHIHPFYLRSVKVELCGRVGR